MGNQLYVRKLTKFIEETTHMKKIESSDEDEEDTRCVAWLSYICLFWVWKEDAKCIITFIRESKDLDEFLFEKSVIDVIHAAKLYRKKEGNPHMTDEERERYHMFTLFRRARGTKQLPICSISHNDTGHVMEYIYGRTLDGLYIM